MIMVHQPLTKLPDVANAVDVATLFQNARLLLQFGINRP